MSHHFDRATVSSNLPFFRHLFEKLTASPEVSASDLAQLPYQRFGQLIRHTDNSSIPLIVELLHQMLDFAPGVFTHQDEGPTGPTHRSGFLWLIADICHRLGVSAEQCIDAIMNMILSILRREYLFEVYDDTLDILYVIMDNCPSASALHQGETLGALEAMMNTQSPTTMGKAARVIGTFFLRQGTKALGFVEGPLTKLIELMEDPSVGVKTRYYADVIYGIGLIVDGIRDGLLVEIREVFARRLEVLAVVPIDPDDLGDLEVGAYLFEQIAAGFAVLIRAYGNNNVGFVKSFERSCVVRLCQNVNRSMAYNEMTLRAIYEMLKGVARVDPKGVNIFLQGVWVKGLLEAGKNLPSTDPEWKRNILNLELTLKSV
jgi:hypothetical protein